MIYADSSALVSMYSADDHSAVALGIFRGLRPPLAFTALHQLELSNALELRQFRKQITAAQAAASNQAIGNDMLTRTLSAVSLNWSQVMSAALALAKRQSRLLGTRSLDILHVAAALEVGVATFVTFDKRQAELARTEGLIVLGA